MLRLYGSTFTPTLTVAIVKEVGDGCRGAAAPGFGGVDGGEDGGHEPLVAVHSEALLAELGVVVGQTEQVTCGIERRRCTEFEMMDARRGDGICHRFAHAARRRKHTDCTGIRCMTSNDTPLILINKADVLTEVHMHALACF